MKSRASLSSHQVSLKESLTNYLPHIGIGRSLTAPPSHTTVHTGPYTAIRLIKTDPNNTTGLLGLGERNATSISATAA